MRKAVSLLVPYPNRCRNYAERSVGKAALHNEELGFMGASELAKRAIETGKSIDELIKKDGTERSG